MGAPPRDVRRLLRYGVRASVTAASYDPAEYATRAAAAARRRRRRRLRIALPRRPARTGSSTTGTRSATGSSRPRRTCSPNLNLTDMETCYKAFRREVIQSIEIEEDRFGFEPEITAKVAARRMARSTRSASRTPAAPTPKARRSAGATACARSTASCATRRAGRAVRGASTARPRSQHPAGRVRRLRRRALRRCCDSLEDADNYADWIFRLVRAAPRRATCSRSAPGTASSPSVCAATRTSPPPTSRSVASTSSRSASPGATNVEVLHADVAALGAERPDVRLRRARQRARAHRRRRRRARGARATRSSPGGRLCVFVARVRRPLQRLRPGRSTPSPSHWRCASRTDVAIRSHAVERASGAVRAVREIGRRPVPVDDVGPVAAPATVAGRDRSVGLLTVPCRTGYGLGRPSEKRRLRSREDLMTRRRPTGRASQTRSRHDGWCDAAPCARRRSALDAAGAIAWQGPVRPATTRASRRVRRRAGTAW